MKNGLDLLPVISWEEIAKAHGERMEQLSICLIRYSLGKETEEDKNIAKECLDNFYLPEELD